MIGLEQVADILNAQTWIFAKTMPTIPHEYCLRRNFESDADFVAVVQYIREQGVVEEWRTGRAFTYLYFKGYKYWTMGEPIHMDGKPHTILINRATCN